MTAAEAFVAGARELVGTRWRHRGRKPWAVDCVGLIVLAGRKAGLTAADVFGYGREPWEDTLRKGCRERWGEPVPLADARPGDIAIFRFGKGEPSHIGILGDHPLGGLSLIHAHNLNGVCECRLAGTYLEGIVEVFRPRFE